MAKGSKKYAGHEYSFTSPAKAGLGKELEKQKASAESSRRDSRTYPKKMSDGGTASPGSTPTPVQGSNTNAALSAMGSAVSNPQKAVGGSLMSRLFGKSQGGEAKKKDNRKDIGDDNKAGSIYEMGSSYKKGGEVKAENKEQKATHKGDSKKDDKIPALLSEGEFVVKKSIMKSKDAPRKAAEVIKKEKDKKKK